MVVFYPGDNTAVCTTQLKSYTADFDEFEGVDAQILANTRALIVPGTSLIVTDAPVNGDTHGTSDDFRVLTTAADE